MSKRIFENVCKGQRAASGSSSRHRRTSDESLMRRLARDALRRLCTGSAARSAWWVWSICLARAPPSRPGPEEARARRTRLSHMDLPAHHRTPRGPQESKEVVAHTMLPYELKVTAAACQTHRAPGARCYLAPLYRWLAGWPPLGNAATSELSGGETLGYTAPPMMVHG
jgi:hypothetical protein